MVQTVVQAQFSEEGGYIRGNPVCFAGELKKDALCFLLLICAHGEASLNFEYLIANVPKHPTAA